MVSTTKPVLKDSEGNVLDKASKDQTIFLSATISNTGHESVPFVMFIEARDENNATQFLEFQLGTVNGQSKVEVGISWQPDDPDVYETRVFLINGFENPKVLTGVETNKFTIE